MRLFTGWKLDDLDRFLSGLIFSVITGALALGLLWLANTSVPWPALAVIAAAGVGFGSRNWGCSAYAFGLGILGAIYALAWGRGSALDGLCVFGATGLVFGSGWYLGYGIFSATLFRKRIRRISK